MLMRKLMLTFVIATATTTTVTTATRAPSSYRRALSSSSLAFTTTRQSSRSSFPQGTSFLSSYSKFSGSRQQQQLQQPQKDTFRTIAEPTRTFSSSSVALKMSSLSNCPTIPLRNGMEHPVIGFGTYTIV